MVRQRETKRKTTRFRVTMLGSKRTLVIHKPLAENASLEQPGCKWDGAMNPIFPIPAQSNQNPTNQKSACTGTPSARKSLACHAPRTLPTRKSLRTAESVSPYPTIPAETHAILKIDIWVPGAFSVAHIWVWLKIRGPKWNPGQWKCGLNLQAAEHDWPRHRYAQRNMGYSFSVSFFRACETRRPQRSGGAKSP